MNSQDIQNIQESYLAVYNDETRENLEFENWVNNLLDEGYDLSDYTWDEMAEIYIGEERAEGVKPYGGGKEVGDKMRAGYGIKITPKPPSGKKGDGSGYGEDKKFAKPDDKIKKPGTTVPEPKKGGYGRISPVIPYGIGANATKERSANSRVRRLDPGAPTSQKLPPPDKKKPSKEIIRKPKPKNEEYDLYDVILSHLIDEGYADTYESAEAIMVNMSEDWRESIVEGLVDTVASGAGTVVGTAQRAAREIPKYVQQKVNNVAGTYERARQRADANAPSGGMTTKARSGEFSHGNQGGKPAATMKNPGPNFGRG